MINKQKYKIVPLIFKKYERTTQLLLSILKIVYTFVYKLKNKHFLIKGLQKLQMLMSRQNIMTSHHSRCIETSQACDIDKFHNGFSHGQTIKHTPLL